MEEHVVPQRLLELMRERGFHDDEIYAAAADGSLHFLAIDQLLGSSKLRYTAVEIAEKVGLDVSIIRRLWRALGFRDFRDDEAIFTEVDLDAAYSLRAIVSEGNISTSSALQLARVMGSSMARFAEAEIVASSAFKDIADDEVSSDPITLADRFTRYSSSTVPTIPQLLVYTWLRHLHAASTRALIAIDSGAKDVGLRTLAVGFLDLVGFTVISQQLSIDELSHVVGRFEEVSFEVVSRHNGRVVKMIGDEVMFVVESPVEACAIALELAEYYSRDSQISNVRGGLSYGEVLVQDGDYYGSVVNTASRIVNIAAPGTTLATRIVGDMALDSGLFTAKSLNPRELKDIGVVDLSVVRRLPEANTGNTN